MANPIVMITTLKIKIGRLDDYRKFTREATEYIEANRPGTVAILENASEDGTEISIALVFSDAEAMQAHMAGIGEFPNRSRELAEVDKIQIHGQPNEATLEMMNMIGGSGIVLDIKPQWIGGYIHLGTE
jgi:hypothetical protein